MPESDRPSTWAINRAREVPYRRPDWPSGCECHGHQRICDTHWAIAQAIDQAYFEGRTGVQH